MDSMEEHIDAVATQLSELENGLKSPTKLLKAYTGVQIAKKAVEQTRQKFLAAHHQQLNIDPALHQQRDQEKAHLEKCYEETLFELVKYLASQEAIDAHIDALHEALADAQEASELREAHIKVLNDAIQNVTEQFSADYKRDTARLAALGHLFSIHNGSGKKRIGRE